MKSRSLFSSDNNFNIIRLYLATGVMFFHCFELSKRSELNIFSRIFDADGAVKAFFIISGYLISRSYEREPSVKVFFTKRLKRIYPAYFTLILFCTVAGCMVSTYSPVDYFKSPLLYNYFFSNALFLNFIQPGLPGVFTNNAFTAINGSLWSLKVEIGFYLLVPVIFYLRSRVNTHILYAFIFITSSMCYIVMLRLYAAGNNDTYLFLSRQIPGQLFFFILGAWVSELESSKLFMTFLKWAGACCLVLLCVKWGGGVSPVTEVAKSIVLAGTVFFMAFSIPVINYRFKREDISYGIYIYHFPVIQLFVYTGWYNYAPWYALLLSLLFTLIIAIISWVTIEKVFIRSKVKNERLAQL